MGGLFIRKLCTVGILICLVSIALLLSGCCGSMNVSNTNNAIDKWNNLIDIQSGLDLKMTDTMTVMGDHINTYNYEISRSTPNYGLLITNFQIDKNGINSWDTDLSNLNTAITDFSSSTASLSGDSKQDASNAATYMRTYHTNMQNAQLAYIAYCDDMINYIKSAQNGNPDSSVLSAANSMKDQANTDVQNAVAAGNQATDSMKRIGK